MDDTESWKIRARILRKLLKFRKVGGAHTEARNAVKGLPSDFIGQAKKELKWLIKEDYLWAKPSTGEIHVSINPHALKAVRAILEKYIEVKDL